MSSTEDVIIVFVCLFVFYIFKNYWTDFQDNLSRGGVIYVKLEVWASRATF